MMAKKRPRERASVDTQVVEIYEDLANENEEIRLRAAQALLSKVSLETKPTKDQLDKVLKRLIRGLCSGRKAARLGFSVALTEFLIQHATTNPVDSVKINTSEILEIMAQQTFVTGSIAGQEERDHYFGKVFGVEAIIKSGILFRVTGVVEPWERVLDLIYDIAKKKTWLREECGWVLYEALNSLSHQDGHIIYTQILLDKLTSSGLGKSSEGVALWIKTKSLNGIVMPPGVWHADDPLSRKEKSSLSRILKGTSPGDIVNISGEKPTQKGMWFSKLHFAWGVVLDELLKDESHGSRFQGLWNEAVDDSLFAAVSSDERKYWGFLLFQKYIADAPIRRLHILFSTNLVRCLVNHLASRVRYLHLIAEKCLKAIHSRAQREPLAVLPILHSLLDTNGLPTFDLLTKTKTIEKLLVQADLSSFGDVLHMIDRIILRPGIGEERAAFVARQTLAEYLVAFVRSRPYPDEDDSLFEEHRNCMDKVMELLVRHGFFRLKPSPSDSKQCASPQISSSTPEMFRSRVVSALAHLIMKAPKPAHHPYRALQNLRSQVSRTDQSVPLFDFDSDSDMSKSIRRAWRALEQIADKEASAEPRKRGLILAFKLLYTLTILQVYSGDMDAVGLLDELHDCYKLLLKHKSKERQDEASELLVEIILSIVSRSSVLFKRIANQVFSVCSLLVNGNGLQSMIKVLDTRETVSGKDDIFDHADEHSDAAELSDVEMFDGEALDEEIVDEDSSSSRLDGASNEPDSDSSEDFSTGDDSAEHTDEELAIFDAKLAQALGTRGAGDDLNANDEGGSSDEDMNDEQMEALDGHLEKVFSEQKRTKTKKAENKVARDAVILFKARVIELLEIYIKQHYLNPLALELILPLLTLVQTTTSKQISEKACNLIREYSKLYKMKDKLVSENTCSLVAAADLLQKVHIAASKEGSNAYGTACSQASVLVAKIMLTNGSGVEEVVDQYASTQKKFLTDPSCRIKTAFFSDWLNWCTSARKSLAI